MGKVTVYRFEVWNHTQGENQLAPRPATRANIERINGGLLADTATEVDESDLDGNYFLKAEKVLDYAHEEQREVEVLEAAKAAPGVSTYYSSKAQLEHVATAIRLAKLGMIEISERPMPGAGPTVYLMAINDSGRVRLQALQKKFVAEHVG